MSVGRLGCRWLIACALCAGATGCRRHVIVPPPPVAPVTIVPLAQAPEPDRPVLVQSVPVIPSPLPSKAVQPARQKKARKKVVEATSIAGTSPAPAAALVPPPNQVASAANPALESVIGSLSAGGEAAPAEKQKAADEIVAIEKRLGALSQTTVDNQKDGLLRVRSFLRQAHEALKSGDGDGANTLVTKAGVLLDDLLK
jgi:hypothetical protein